MTRRGVALFDIDRTIYDGYVIFPLAGYLSESGIIARDTVENLCQDLRLYESRRVGYAATVQNLNIHLAAGLKDASPGSVLSATSAFLQTPEGNRFFPFTRPLMELLGATHDIYLVTGEVQPVGQAVADYLSAKGYVSSEMEVHGDLFTGNITRSLAGREGKGTAIGRLFEGYPLMDSLGFGDSEGDIELLSRVAYPFCINSTEGLEKVAVSRGWHLVNPVSIMEAVRSALLNIGGHGA
jgi:phosphoserine phosphatase